MKPFKAKAHIHSLDGAMGKITVLENKDNTNYIVDYNGVKCTAIFNWAICSFFVDDIYGIIKEDKKWKTYFTITAIQEYLI